MAKTKTKSSAPKRAQLQTGDTAAFVTPDVEAETPVPEVGEGKSHSGKKYTEKQLLLVGTWVILDDTKNVPEELVGHEGYITIAPMKTSDGDEQVPFRHQYQDEDCKFTVKTRDQYSATVSGLTREDFREISYNGRHGLGHAG